MQLEIKHPSKIVSFAFTDNETKDLFTYYFKVENAKIILHSIDVYRKNGKSGNTYKHEEVFHFEYKKTVTNYETGEFEPPKVPEEILEAIHDYQTGFLVNSLINTDKKSI